ncbi:MAG: TonB-dependent receptor [Acidobacteriota bacterium]
MDTRQKPFNPLSRAFGTGLLIALALLLVAIPAFAQAPGGNVYATTTDSDGAKLPGVTVTLNGQGAPQVAVSDVNGEARFLNLSPGDYQLQATLEGFQPVETSIAVRVDRNTTLDIVMTTDFGDIITVTGGDALLDPRKVTAGTSVEQIELEKIPTARDPWAILQTVPGVKVDRINVGGNESGQQSQYIGPGSSGDNAVWSIDGVVITDMSAVGSSPLYYDFGSFEEMNISTGGSDAALSTGGVTLNMVTKRGTNEWRGSGRYFYGDDSTQGDLEFDASDLGQAGPWNGDNAQEEFRQGNRIVENTDYGAELGGPIVRDRVWFWANYGRQQPKKLTINDFPDNTDLESFGGKINAQITSGNSAVAFYNNGEKTVVGRNASPTRPGPAAWNQSGPNEVIKLEDTQIVNSSFFVTGMIATVDSEFVLTPQGGFPDGPVADLDPDNIWRNNFQHYETTRPQDQARLDGSYFLTTGEISHELKFGAGYRSVDTTSLLAWPQQMISLSVAGLAALNREGITAVSSDYTSLFAQDTLSIGNATINVGLRYDAQDGQLDSATVRGVPGFEDADPASGFRGLPTATFNGGDDGFDWETITPRIGVTWALGEERMTLLRASYSQFADQLSHGTVSQIWPVAGSFAYFTFTDLNGDGQATDFSEINRDGFLFDTGYDPLAQTSVNQVDPSYNAPLTDELILGVEHQIAPELVIGLQGTYRILSDLAENERLVIGEDGAIRTHRRDDYVLAGTVEGTLPDGSSYSVPYYGLRDGISETQGFRLENGDREQEYLGLSLSFTKRLANRWMLRGNVTWSDWTWDIPESELEDPNTYLGNLNVDGADVLFGSGAASGAKGNVYINSDWSYSVSALYQIAPDRPWGFNAGLALNGRQGYPTPYFRGNVALPGISTGADTAGTAPIQVADSDDFRNEDVVLVDARLEKEVQFGDLGVTFSIDGFNLFNESNVLQRQSRLNVGNADHVQEILSPRVFRFGVRFSFN